MHKTADSDTFLKFIEARALEKGPSNGDEAYCLPDAVQCDVDVVYAQYGDLALSADIFYRKQGRSEQRPAMLFVHGGGWQAGSREQFKLQAAYLALRYDALCMCISYRFSDVAPFPAQLHDSKAALRFLRAHAARYHIDPENISACGGSAGGHLVLMLAMTAGVEQFEGDGGHAGISSHVRVAIGNNPPTDLGQRAAEVGDLERMIAFIGCSYADNKAAYDHASPMHWAHKDAAPILLTHGTADVTVKCKQSAMLHEKYQECGALSVFKTTPDVGHGWFNHPPYFRQVLGDWEVFLQEHADWKLVD